MSLFKFYILVYLTLSVLWPEFITLKFGIRISSCHWPTRLDFLFFWVGVIIYVSISWLSSSRLGFLHTRIFDSVGTLSQIYNSEVGGFNWGDSALHGLAQMSGSPRQNIRVSTSQFAWWKNNDCWALQLRSTLDGGMALPPSPLGTYSICSSYTIESH